jgi:hypothetical protein
MVRPAHEVVNNAAVGLVDAPASVHKAEILRAALPAGAQLTFVRGIDTLERFRAHRYYGDGSITAMHAALRRLFAPDGDNSRIICTRRVMELALTLLDDMPRDLNTASLPTQRAANDARKDG